MKRKAVFLVVATLLAAGGTHAHENTVNGTSASASLDFVIDMGKFIFLRVGAVGLANMDSVAFNAVPTIPPGAVVAVPGNNTTVNWGGTLPPFTATATTLPVEVRSNAGQVRIWATVTAPLVSGANTIPMSAIVLTSSNPAGLPAPVLPAAGVGASVNVPGTAWSNLVTERNANWTFSYNPPATVRAGVYSGQVSFTASTP